MFGPQQLESTDSMCWGSTTLLDHSRQEAVRVHLDLCKHGVAGASDCASCVAVALELARLMVADRQIKLSAPVVFLLNGGEEAFLLGAHAFTAHSGYNTGIGAFVNLYVFVSSLLFALE